MTRSTMKQSGKPSQSYPRAGCASTPVSGFRFNANGYHVNLNVDPGLPVPYSSGCGNNGSLSGAIAAEVQQFAIDAEDAKTAQRSARQQLWAILESLNTLAQLKESWPEGKPFYAYLEKAERKPSLPVARQSGYEAHLGRRAAVYRRCGSRM